MTYVGRVVDGVVVLQSQKGLRDGTVVHVTPLKPAAAKKSPRRKRENKALKDLSRMLLSFAGTVKGLPRDLARNHDHYLHGHPKK